MRKIIVFISVFVIMCHTAKNYSYDSTAAKYMPLQIGNIWVYYGFSHQYPNIEGSSFNKYKIIDIIDTLGKRYFNFQITRLVISGNGGGGFSFLTKVRIDSSNMNLLYIGDNGCRPLETVLDSLNSKKNDTVECAYAGNRILSDTGSHSIFNVSIASKRFVNDRGNANITYLKDVGICRYEWGELMNWAYDTLRGCFINGVLHGDTNTIVGINQIGTETPINVTLSQNYPNPFNPSTNIKFQIANSSNAKLIIYDALGKEVVTLLDKKLEPGEYEGEFDGTNHPSGVYFYKLVVGDNTNNGGFIETKKMVLIK